MTLRGSVKLACRRGTVSPPWRCDQRSRTLLLIADSNAPGLSRGATATVRGSSIGDGGRHPARATKITFWGAPESVALLKLRHDRRMLWVVLVRR